MSRKIRCAIYTRKSTEDGLDQEFNWCQTNSNSSQLGQGRCSLCHAKTAPLGESVVAVQFEI